MYQQLHVSGVAIVVIWMNQPGNKRARAAIFNDSFVNSPYSAYCLRSYRCSTLNYDISPVLPYVAPTVDSTSETTVDVFYEERHELSLLQPQSPSLRLKLQGSRLAESRGRVELRLLCWLRRKSGVGSGERGGGEEGDTAFAMMTLASHRETFGLPM